MQASQTTLSLQGDVARSRSTSWRQARRHTILVKTLRTVFPLIAAASLGLYFFSSDLSIPVAGGKASVEKIEMNAQNLKMINPKFAGFGSGEERYEVRAKSALQDVKAPNKVTLNTITADLIRAKGDWVKMTASKGFYDTNGTKLDLFGGIVVTSKSGMQATLKSAAVDVKSQEVVSTEPVNVKLPNGTVRADRLRIFPKQNRLRFEGRVKVRFTKQAGGGGVAAPSAAQIKGVVQ